MRSEIFLLLAFVSITSSHQSALRRQNVLAGPPNNITNQGLEDQQFSPDRNNYTTAIHPQIRKILRVTSGIIKSKNFPGYYPNNFDNTVPISVGEWDRIEIKFLEFEIEGNYGYYVGQCPYDWLTITEESGVILLPKTCGKSTPATIESNSNRVFINFHSDDTVPKKGFKIQWKVIPGTPPCFCGLIPKSTRIVGGYETVVNQHPWMATVRPGTFCGNWGPCGGSLLNNQWVITAAHCIDSSPAEDNRVELGQHDLIKDTSKVVVIMIQKVIIHPQFTKYDSYDDFDFALIKLSSKVDFSLHTHVRPICLPKTDQIVTETWAVVAGWGSVSQNPTKCKTVLRETYVKTYKNDECKKDHRNKITPRMICAKGNRNSDACVDDSGGPLIQQERISCRYRAPNRCYLSTLIGVVSWGPDPCDKPVPGVYGRISSVLDWIKNNIEGDGSISCRRP